MSGAGRKRLPRAVKEAKGTLQSCRENPNEPQPDLVIPAPPDFLKGEAFNEWNRIAPELESLGIISNLDLGVLVSYCSAYGNMADAQKEWQEQGSPLTTKSVNGILMVHPLLTITNQAREQMRKFAAEMGLTPASRSKVSGKPKGQSKDPWAEL